MAKDKNTLGINPKDYKHLKSDDKSTTLQHKKGHTITISHAVLSKPNRDILKALADTGKNYQTEGQRQESEDQYRTKKADGGEVCDESGFMPTSVTGYAKGGKVSDKERMANVNKKQIEMAKAKYSESSKLSPERQKKNDVMDKFMRNTAGSGKRVDFYEGGETNKVRMDSTRTEKPRQDGKKEHIIPANLHGPKDLNEAWDRIKNAFASGGEVAVRKMYADGGYAAEDAAIDREVNNNEAMGQRLADIGNVSEAINTVPQVKS